MTRRILALLAPLLAVLALAVATPAPAHAVTRDGTILLTARLSGANEVPPADRDGAGRAVVTLRGDRVCFAVTWTRIGAPTMAHIHRGAAGVNGPHVVGLFMNDQNRPLPPTLGLVGGCGTASRAVVAAIRANPAGYYVNVHNRQYPDGVIRGQLG
jgi:hypothetical protein